MAVDLTRYYAVGSSLLSCCLAELALTPGGVPSRACVVPGISPADENCCDGGQLSVSLAITYPSSNFPIEDITFQPCGTIQDALEYVIRLVRCAPAGDENANPPTCEALDAAAQIYMADMLAVRRAEECCFTRPPFVDDPYVAVVIGRQTGIVPLGGCVGSESRLWVANIQRCGCDA